MKIHAIQTGTVAVTTAWREGVGHGQRRLLNTIVDRQWTEPPPIYAFAIEHPEGVIVVDTGEAARASGPGYLAAGTPACAPSASGSSRNRRSAAARGARHPPSNVRWVEMTHPHTDHAGGLHHFPDNEILVTRAELEFASGLRGRLRGYVANKRWPDWFDPTVVDLEPTRFGPFPQSLRLTEAGDVVLVPCPAYARSDRCSRPGRRPHRVPRGGQLVYAGAHAPRQGGRRRRGRASGAAHTRANPDYASANPTVYLVAHDPESAARLAGQRLMYPIEAGVAARSPSRPRCGSGARSRTCSRTSPTRATSRSGTRRSPQFERPNRTRRT